MLYQRRFTEPVGYTGGAGRPMIGGLYRQLIKRVKKLRLRSNLKTSLLLAAALGLAACARPAQDMQVQDPYAGGAGAGGFG